MWLHLPSTCLASAPEPECSTLRSDCVLMLAQSATLKGKHTQPRFWHRAWQRRRWMKRLSGLTLPPLTANRGVASWIASLQACRASPTAPQESSGAIKTSAALAMAEGLSHTPCASSKKSNPPWYSLRMSRRGSRQKRSGSSRSGSGYANWVTRSKTRSSRLRQAWALLTSGSACSYWPSTRSEDAESCGNHPGAVDSLTGAVSQWHTPRANDSEKRGECKNHHRNGIVSQAMNWPTPNTLDMLEPKTAKALLKEMQVTRPGRAAPGNLRDFVTQMDKWQTPGSDSFRSRGGSRKAEMGLDQQSRQWSTPHSHNAHGAPGKGLSSREGRRRDLVREAMVWPSPAARDMKGANSAAHVTRVGGGGVKHMDQLANYAVHSRPARRINDGVKSSPQSRGAPRRLNPAFTAWLMGWPWWWTHSETINCAQSEMALYRCALRQRLACLLDAADSLPDD